MPESYATYCIIDSACDLAESVIGLYGCRVRNLACREIGVAVSPCMGPVDDIVAGSLVHETVIERLMQTHTVLPMRFPTALAGQEAVFAMMTQHYDSFQENLRRLRGQVEFGVRVLWPQVVVGAGQTESLARSGFEGRTSRGAEPAGRLYMLDRCRQHREHQALSEHAARFGARLDAALSASATAKRLHDFASGAFVFNGVYLVNKDKEADFRRAFLKAKDSKPDFRYLFSGPWPAYNFIAGPPVAPEARTAASSLVEYLGLAATGGTHDRGTES